MAQILFTTHFGTGIGEFDVRKSLWNLVTQTCWHVPSDAEFGTLELYPGVPPAQINFWGRHGTDQATQMKSTTGWIAGGNGTNTSSFSTLPGGYRY